MFKRPEDKEELQKREAIGVIRASRFVRRYAKSHEPITIETVHKIHEQIFKDAWPEIAGSLRTTEVKIRDSVHVPPHHSEIPELLKKVDEELLHRQQKLKHAEGILFNRSSDTTENFTESIEEIIKTAAWLHHIIAFIHPYQEGNGRTARLAANLIFERYGLLGMSIKIEKENKNQYRAALRQIDQMQDFEPLMTLIYKGLMERFSGVDLKYYEATN